MPQPLQTRQSITFFLTLSTRPVFPVSSLYSSRSFSNLFLISFFPCLRVISRSCANATLEERRDPVIDKASFDAFLYKTLSWLDSLKRCRPRGSFVDGDVSRRTRTKKYIELAETLQRLQGPDRHWRMQQLTRFNEHIRPNKIRSNVEKRPILER